MTGVARIRKLDFFIMKSQGISYLSSDETKVNPEYDSFLKPVRVIS